MQDDEIQTQASEIARLKEQLKDQDEVMCDLLFRNRTCCNLC